MYPSRRSPSIRSPSLLQSSNPSSLRQSSSLTRPLPPRLKRLVQSLIVLLVAWFEYGLFYLDARSTRWNCFIEGISRRKPLSDPQEGGGTSSNILIVTDPQVLDMNRSYPDRNSFVKWLTIKITNQFMKKSWYVLTLRRQRVDAVVWNGDLLDNGREMNTEKEKGNQLNEYDTYTRQFHQLFPLPRHNPSSSSTSSRTLLDPPVPVIYVPGNHDLLLHPSLSTSSSSSEDSPSVKDGRTEFETSFGPLYGEKLINGWKLIWIDSIALIEPSFFSRNPSPRSLAMRNFIETLSREGGEPRILFTHIPLYRLEGETCGVRRESKRFGGGIRDGRGDGYQNLVGEKETNWLLEKIKPEKVFSGDDHDYCFYQHPFVSPSEPKTNITETTVKSFSIAMGISQPGYSILTLHSPPSSSSPLNPSLLTYTERTCSLPNQVGIYVKVYLPLAILLFLAFFVPKVLVVGRRILKRRNKKGQRNGILGTGIGRGKSERSRTGIEKELVEDQDQDSIFPTFSSGGGVGGGTGGSSGGGNEYGYSLNLGAGDEESGPISNRPTPSLRDHENELDSSEDSDDDKDVWGRSSRSGNGRRKSNVRRVSRVWSWEEDSSNSKSLLSTPRISLNGLSQPAYDQEEDDYYSSPSLLSHVRNLPHSIVNRLSQNTLLLPFLRLFKPLLRFIRTLLFVVLGTPLSWLMRLFGIGGSKKGFGRAVRESGKEFWDVTKWGIAVWAVVWVWIAM